MTVDLANDETNYRRFLRQRACPCRWARAVLRSTRRSHTARHARPAALESPAPRFERSRGEARVHARKGSKPESRKTKTAAPERVYPGPRSSAPTPRRASEPCWIGRSYFLWRARFRSFRCLCFRIFLRRFLITLPTGSLRTRGHRAGQGTAAKSLTRPPGERTSREAGFERGRFRESRWRCQARTCSVPRDAVRPARWTNRRRCRVVAPPLTRRADGRRRGCERRPACG